MTTLAAKTALTTTFRRSPPYERAAPVWFTLPRQHMALLSCIQALML